MYGHVQQQPTRNNLGVGYPNQTVYPNINPNAVNISQQQINRGMGSSLGGGVGNTVYGLNYPGTQIPTQEMLLNVQQQQQGLSDIYGGGNMVSNEINALNVGGIVGVNNPSNSVNSYNNMISSANANNFNQSNYNGGVENVGLGGNSGTGNSDSFGNNHNQQHQSQQQGKAVHGGVDKMTPLLYLNELIKFNKIDHSYVLVNEQGPAHSKLFVVSLKLGAETYEGSGSSIKKAQNAAAMTALEKTQYTRPQFGQKKKGPAEKIPVVIPTAANNTNCITPTVKLNSLAVKCGLKVTYQKMAESVVNNNNVNTSKNNVGNGPNKNKYGGQHNYSGGYTHHSSNSPMMHHTGESQHGPYAGGQFGGVNMGYPHNQYSGLGGIQDGGNQYGSGGVGTLEGDGRRMGGKGGGWFQVPGVGVFKKKRVYGMNFVQTHKFTVAVQVNGKCYTGEGLTMQAAKHQAATKAMVDLEPEAEKMLAEKFEKMKVDEIEAKKNKKGSGEKSCLQILLELAHRRKLKVYYEDCQELGTAANHLYQIKCVCGPLTVEAQGTNKREAKKTSAQRMIQELHKYPNLVGNQNGGDNGVSGLDGVLAKQVGLEEKKKMKKFIFAKYRKHIRNINKLQMANPDYGQDLNPVTRLVQIQQAKKEPAPVFASIGGSNGGSAGDSGVISGNNNGALKNQQPSYVVMVTIGDKSCSEASNSKRRAKSLAAEKMLQLLGYSQSKIVESVQSDSIGPQQQQKLNDNSGQIGGGVNNKKAVNNLKRDGIKSQKGMHKGKKVTFIDGADLQNTINSNANINEKLDYLSKRYNFQVEFSDFPVENQGKFITLITLGTNPPQNSHGEGNNPEEARQAAISNALQNLKQLGLDGMGSLN